MPLADYTRLLANPLTNATVRYMQAVRAYNDCGPAGPSDDVVDEANEAAMALTVALDADEARARKGADVMPTTLTAAKVLTKDDPEPDARPGTLAVVNYGEYREQEVWVASGSNIGAWYPLGGEHWVVWDRKRMPAGVTKDNPVWHDVVARGPVVLVVPAAEDAYRQGWDDGRRDLYDRIEGML